MSFTLLKSQNITELNSVAKLYVHDQTGARLLSVCNDDENKCFGINFRTPTSDSTGVAHILEHSVLCGSQKYPVKEPFVEIIKGSLQTFVNAFTYPDKTCYPCASQNLQDFYNLIDIYIDAVFYPNISEMTFKQEGWHYEITDVNAPLEFKGVVFNEMKGAYSSPDDLLADKSRNSIFPDTIYKNDSGGDPLAIPDLTYEQFKKFHSDHYHPSNSYIYFYGDDPESARLELLEKVLSKFEKNAVDTSIVPQKNFSAPVEVTLPYDSGDSTDSKGYITINWKLTDATDDLASLKFSMLDHILLGTAASPMKRALLESELGEEIVGGFDDNLQQTMFSIGLKGVEPEKLGDVENLIKDTLNKIITEGIDPGTIKASLNTLEFHLREQNSGRFPRGLALMLGALSTWIYGGDPIDTISFEHQLSLLKEQISKPGLFESLIEEFLIGNDHRSTVKLLPDANEGVRRANLEKDRLEKVKASLSLDSIQQLIEQTEALKLFQITPDTEESLATIPSLSIEDLDRTIKTTASEQETLLSVATHHQNIFTNGIIYFDLGFELTGLPRHLIPYLGILGKVLLELGTNSQDFIQLTQRIGQETGGIRTATFASNKFMSADHAHYYFVRGKALVSQTQNLLDLLVDILLNVKLDQKDRFKQIVTERRSGLESGLIPGGANVINQRLKAHFSVSDRLMEEVSGIEQIFFLRSLLDRIDNDWDSVLYDLRDLYHQLVARERCILNTTLDETNYIAIKPLLGSFIEKIPDVKVNRTSVAFEELAINEAFTLPTQVNYVASGIDLFKNGYVFDGSINVINNYLQMTYLWERVRVQGGAYGGFSAFDLMSGCFNFLSYRDPNVMKTIENYDATGDFLVALKISQPELVKSIIGTIGDLDAYLLPDAKGWQAFTRKMLNVSDSDRQRIRDQVFATKPSDFVDFGNKLNELIMKQHSVILGSTKAMDNIDAIKGSAIFTKKIL